jgi:hypothetical protein
MKVPHLPSEMAHPGMRHGKVSDRTEAEVDLCVHLSLPPQRHNTASPVEGSLTHPSNATRFVAIRHPRTAQGFRSCAHMPLYGAAKAAKRAGEPQESKAFHEQVVALCSQADTERPELLEAKAFLAKK